jgi:uncharacterized protein DUF3943
MGPAFHLILGCVLLCAVPRQGFGQEPLTTPHVSATLSEVDEPALSEVEEPALSEVEEPALSEVEGSAPATAPIPKNYFVPVLDIVVFDTLLNRFNYRFIDRATYRVTTSSIRRNATSSWVLDNDPFSINQFLHPYQGSMYHGFARSAGLNYWQSFVYTFAGSALWEIAGETTLPSRNDQIATGIGGTFLGEPLFRLASRVLERSDHLSGFWRELSAAVISPATGFNRLAYGGRFDGVFPSHNPPSFTRIQFGMMGTASVQRTLTQRITRNEAVADFSSAYGLPGDAKYAYQRPFDYFNFQFTTSTGSRFENIFARGLLVGTSYARDGDRYRGVWGLYGTYDYVAPQVFRVSSTALALGTTLERKLSGSGALQSTLLAGAGYGAGGGIGGENGNDYHFGLTPQVLADVRIIPTDRIAFDLTLRDYYVSRLASVKHQGSEHIARADALISIRLKGRHGASARYIWSRRSASGPEPGRADIIQSRGSFGLFYTYMHGTRFGAVDFQD